MDKRALAIKFSAGGGLLYLRLEQKWNGTEAGPPALASFEFPNVGWSFDGFTVQATKDPNASTGASVVNPVSASMVQALQYWPHRKTISVQSTSTSSVPGRWVVDTANWTVTLGNQDTWINWDGTQEEAEEGGYGILREVLGDLPFTREDIGSHLVDTYDGTLNLFTRTPLPPDPRFFVIAASATPNWTYHQEPPTTYTFYSRMDTATVIINLAKLKAALPNPKPDTYTFRIREPDFPGPGPKNVNNLDWRVDAAAYLTRRDFPVEDVEANGDIVAYQSPTWNSWSGDAASGGGNINALRATNNYVEVTVFFAKAGQPPRAEITSFGAGT
jgi:hypothetical protein